MQKTVLLTVNAADQESVIARAIVAREREIMGYEINIANYEAMIAAGGLTPEFSKTVQALLVTENLERAKSIAVYNALKAQVTPANLAGAVAAAKAALPPL